METFSEDTKTPPIEKWYRYEDRLTTGGPYIYFYEYPVIKHTKCGVWLDLGYGSKRFVLEHSRKRFACPSKELAKKSFIARKERQRRIYKARLDQVEYVLEAIKHFNDEPFHLGLTINE